MPLRDHFNPPLSQRRDWKGAFNGWTNALADQLNGDRLPKDFFAEPRIHVGGIPAAFLARNAPPPVYTIPTVFPDSYEVQVINSDAGPRLVAAIELISPGNKDRPETRRAFVAKCASYLSLGISVIIVDVVTNRRSNLHDELLDFLGQPTTGRLGEDVELYAAAYRPLMREKRSEIDLWPVALQLGATLPTLPLFPAVDLAIPVDFEDAYAEACERLRVS
mgnify:CR=1 FL=1